MAKKLLSVFLVCILTVTMVTGCGGRANNEDDDTPRKSVSDRADREEKSSGKEEDKNDKDTSRKVEKEIGEFKITIDPPKGWKENQYVSTVTVLYYYKEVKGLDEVRSFLINKWDPDSTFKTFATAKEAAEYYVDSFKDLYEDSAEVSEIKQLSINGLDAFRIDIVMEAFDYLEKKVIVLFMKGETLFEVNGICLADDKEGADEIEDILKSLRID